MSEINLDKAREVLTQPIQPDEIEWRPKNLSKDGTKLLVLPYINGRCVMERFDEAFGWENWSSETEVIEGNLVVENGKSKSYERGFATTIRVNTPDGIVSKTDVGENSDIEPLKGGYSDSLKRCAVQFGVGRDLYKYPTVYIECGQKYIPTWAKAKLDALVNWLLEGNKKDLIILKEK